MPTLLPVVAELLGQGEWHLRRQRRLSSFEGRGEHDTQRVTLERPGDREPANVEESFIRLFARASRTMASVFSAMDVSGL